MTSEWPEMALGDICTFNYGKSLPAGSRSGHGYPVFGSNGEVGRHEIPLTTGPTIIVGRKGSFGEVHFSDEPCWPIDTTYFIDTSSTTADLRWLMHRLRSLGLTSLNRAAAIPGLNREDAYRQRLLVPPIEEQRRIAAVLDEADGLRTRRRRSRALLDLAVGSAFREMFRTHGAAPVTVSPDPPVHALGWKWETLTSVARLATGHTPDRTRPEYWDGDIPWISLTEIRELDGTVATGTELTVSEEGIRNSSSVVLPPGTVCFSRTASIGFVTVMGREMATSQDFVNWVCGEALHPIYLMHALLASREQLRGLSTGSTHRTIYMRVAERFRVLVPPIAIQRRFAAFVDSQKCVSSAQQASEADLQALFFSLQHRAFAGQL